VSKSPAVRLLIFIVPGLDVSPHGGGVFDHEWVEVEVDDQPEVAQRGSRCRPLSLPRLGNPMLYD